jgi:hypothetical protein
MTMRIRYACPYCERRITHHPELAGQLVICSACKGEFYEPTDPLPGKAAEKALKPLKGEKRRLRVPVGMDQKHDLAVLSPGGSSDHRSIEEIVEAVLLDGGAAPDAGSVSETLVDFDPVAMEEETIPKLAPGRSKPKGGKLPAAPKLAGPAVPSLMPPTAASPGSPPPDFTSPVPAFRPPQKQSGGTPAAPKGTKTPIVSTNLTGVSTQQMVEELRRRGLGVAMVTCEMAPMRNLQVAFSDNMTRDDAMALLRKFLDSHRGGEEKQPARSGVLKRLWKSEDEQS